MSTAEPRTSLLTSGLKGLAAKSKKIDRLVQDLFELDATLQQAHQRAKEDDEFGEDVVTAYTQFLAGRQRLIDELERAGVAVPWQLRVRVDDLELTLRQRNEKNGTSASSTDSKSAASSTATTAASSTTTTEKEPSKTESVLTLAAMSITSIAAFIIAWLVYKAIPSQ